MKTFTIIDAWNELRLLDSNSSRDAVGIAKFNLITACQQMKGKTIRTSCRKLASHLVANHRNDFESECDSFLIETANRIIADDPTLNDDDPEGFLQSGLIFACMNEIDRLNKNGWATSYHYSEIKDNLPKQVAFDIEKHDLPYEDRGFKIVEAKDMVNNLFSSPMGQLIAECAREDGDFSLRGVARTLGCSPTTISNVVDGIVATALRADAEYALGV